MLIHRSRVKQLFAKRDVIEKESGLSYDWQELPGKKASRIIITNPADFEDASKWPEQFDWIMDTLIKMKKTFKKHI